MTPPRAKTRSASEFVITAAQAEAVAALAKLYMRTERLTITAAPDLTGWIVARTDKWRWFIGEDGRVTAEGKLDDD